MSTKAKLHIANSKAEVAPLLHAQVISCVQKCSDESKFVIALSGGSLPAFLSANALIQSFADAGVNPQWNKWYVFLADERCVKNDHPDSNYCSIQQHMLTAELPIPADQVFPIDDALLDDTTPGTCTTENIAKDYEDKLKSVLGDNGKFDCILCGFGPDGHTCSLFPDHDLLKVTDKMVASITDSPKPPPERVTLTFPVLNAAKTVIFCGAGGSKALILDAVFAEASLIDDGSYDVVMADPAPYPCGMVQMECGDLCWVVDKDAVTGVEVLEKS
uniref:6-phosphogluconolactonase n=1 Tax=Leptocylindrus danicus TaxID=163516 RepID=A0A7S2LKF2_9STRA